MLGAVNASPPSPMKPKILIVDDQADIRRLVRWALEDSPYVIYEAANGALGLQLAQTVRPDLVLLDVMMPGGMDGLEVCKTLRADPAFANTLIVMLTAAASEQDKAEALGLGANFFLAKPFSPAKLLELLGILLRGRKT